jgi:hypothetical protein
LQSVSCSICLSTSAYEGISAAAPPSLYLPPTLLSSTLQHALPLPPFYFPGGTQQQLKENQSIPRNPKRIPRKSGNPKRIRIPSSSRSGWDNNICELAPYLRHLPVHKEGGGGNSGRAQGWWCVNRRRKTRQTGKRSCGWRGATQRHTRETVDTHAEGQTLKNREGVQDLARGPSQISPIYYFQYLNWCNPTKLNLLYFNI